MARIETALVTYLNGQSTLSALISNRLYALRAPQKVVYPFVIYQRISTERNLTHDLTASGLTTPRIQFDVYGKTYKSALEVMDVLRETLQGLSTTMSGVMVQSVLPALEMHDVEPDEEYYRLTVDYLISYSEV